jgi:hypothetical protein
MKPSTYYAPPLMDAMFTGCTLMELNGLQQKEWELLFSISKVLSEPMPSVLFYEVPYIWFLPIATEEFQQLNEE